VSPRRRLDPYTLRACALGLERFADTAKTVEEIAPGSLTATGDGKRLIAARWRKRAARLLAKCEHLWGHSQIDSARVCLLCGRRP
jgi:hypothetical protein